MKPTLNDPKKALAYFQEKLQYTVGPADINHWIEAGDPVNIVDVRKPDFYEKKHVPGAVNLPKERWGDLEALKKDQVNVFYCYSQTCHLAATAAAEFAAKGYSVMEMEGGFDAWEEMGMKTESGPMMVGAGH